MAELKVYITITKKYTIWFKIAKLFAYIGIYPSFLKGFKMVHIYKDGIKIMSIGLFYEEKKGQ